MTRPRRNERGALLGIVLVLLMVLMAASVFAFFTLRSDSGATAQDRLARQLLDCAEQGLALGKTTFSTPTAQSNWNVYFAANTCATSNSGLFPCPPFSAGGGAARSDYPLSNNNVQVALGTSGAMLTMSQLVGIYNNPGDPGGPTTDQDFEIVVWSQCVEPSSKQARTVQALLKVPSQKTGNYFGQAGFGYSNSGNTNNTK